MKSSSRKQLDAKVQEIVARCCRAARSPNRCQGLIRAVNNHPINDVLIEDTAHRIAHLRATPEAREGIAAFLDKRQPNWIGE
jgi:methylglutaconyl-CoA hydratase